MMTPSELRNYEFKGAGRNAYKADDVDAFFGEVAVAYEKIYRENAELARRVNLIADRLEQYKNEENDIKQAILSAQKAADIIVKQAEESVEDTKVEAEAILAAAKGEAEIIKSDAEKQAVADSDLLLSIARDKAEEIINKAKEEAHGILIDANASASDTVGAATRTITSESIHYDMLKKEVSEFRASILAQYKAHIEMISKLPELAVEEADKLEDNFTEDSDETVGESALEFVEEAPENDETELDFSVEEGSEEFGEEVVKTTLPYDFFSEDSSLQFVENEESDEFCDTDEVSQFKELLEDYQEQNDAFAPESDDELAELKSKLNEEAPADIPISRGFNIDTSKITEDDFKGSVFDSIESIKVENDDEESDEGNKEDNEDSNYDDDETKPRGFFGLFRSKK